MTARPTIEAAALAAIVSAAPARLTKKLDATPRLADGWTWSASAAETTVRTETGETVTVRHPSGVLVAQADASCTCLLSPRCLHVLAVASALALVVTDEGSAAASAEAPVAPAPEEATFSAGQVRAARLALAAVGQVVAGGAIAAGAVVQADVLRAAHEARAQGLHRLGSAALRVVQEIRELRTDAVEFALATYTADLGELAAVAHGVARAADRPLSSSAMRELAGVARRTYGGVGDLRLGGLLVEGVVAASGYAGVVTYLADGQGRVWTLPDVVPGDATRVRASYEGGARIGDVSLSPRTLVREGLFVQGATGSPDGRLGAGADVRAVRAGPTTWSAFADLWNEPFARQIARAYAAALLPEPARDARDGLLFVLATVLGVDGDALALGRDDGSGRVVRLVAPSDHSLFAYRENLRLLARAPGLRLALVGRALLDRAGTLTALAIGPRSLVTAGDDEPSTAPELLLPEDWSGRVNLGLDQLQSAHISRLEPAAVPAFDPHRETHAAVDPLLPFRRRVERLALAGARSLTPAAVQATSSERRLLDRRMLPTASALLGRLAEQATRSATGTARSSPAELAEAWLAAEEYDRRARLDIARLRWGD